MDIVELYNEIEGVPYTPFDSGKQLFNFVVEKKFKNCLELGFAHGVSSCYIAAALDELGDGHLTSVDLQNVERHPSIETLLDKTNLARYVDVYREKTSYNWFLKKMIEAQTNNNMCEPLYDFCFIDGAKNWTIDGFAFFLVDKLLKPDGWILFDDYDWTYASINETVTDGVNHRDLGDDELNTPHIELIFKLLILQHPNYSNFTIYNNNWLFAQKTTQPNTQPIQVVHKTSFLNILNTVGRKFYKTYVKSPPIH